MTLEALVSDLEARLPGVVVRDAPVADLSTYHLGGPIAALVRVADESELASVAASLALHRVPVLIVGRGSNLLVADAGFAGLGIVLTGRFEALEIDAARGLVRAGAGLPLPVLARRTAAAGLTGLEFFVGIPGSVGGAVRMNAGGHGAETKDVLVSAWLVDLGARDAVPEQWSVEELGFGYRRSSVGAEWVVTSAELAVRREDPRACEERIAEVVRWRREHQPGGANAGSVFRNPPGDSAGRIIDALGLKGLRVGGAWVSEKHANFFCVEPGATADDVHRLVETVRARVLGASDVNLVPEIHMVGFGQPEGRARVGESQGQAT